jgi:4-hydroxy-3-methylbut-2-enyl diphosphate reductase
LQNADLVIVIGAANSSNSTRLVEVAASRGVPAHRIDSVSDLKTAWFRNVKTVGITAGASAPEYLVQEVVSHLKACYGAEVESDLDGTDEDVHFPLPRNLAAAMRRHPV